MGVDPSGQVLAALTELRRKLPAEIPSIIDEQHLSAYRIQHLSKQLKVSLQRSVDYCESPWTIIKLRKVHNAGHRSMRHYFKCKMLGV